LPRSRKLGKEIRVTDRHSFRFRQLREGLSIPQSATGWMFLLCLLSSSIEADQSAAEAEEAQRDERLAQMRQRAEATKLFRPHIDENQPIVTTSESLVRYSDQPRGIVDATLWTLGGKGRPIAFLKVESYDRKEGDSAWLYSLGTLDEDLIRVEFGDGHRWAAKKPGLEWKSLPDGPAPADSERGRLSQMKEIIRRFKVTAEDPSRGREEQRLLARPLHHYSDANAGIMDGAVFGFTTYGTHLS
jgi:hypothetical protein